MNISLAVQVPTVPSYHESYLSLPLWSANTPDYLKWTKIGVSLAPDFLINDNF
jgi:hypothetical protein